MGKLLRDMTPDELKTLQRDGACVTWRDLRRLVSVLIEKGILTERDFPAKEE